MTPAFPIDEFIATFPNTLGSYNEDGEYIEKYPRAYVVEMGNRAMMHVGPEREGMPMCGQSRFYALFLMTLHMIELDQRAKQGGGDGVGGLSGIPFKAKIGSVEIEATKPNTFTTEDWDYYLKQTEHGRELLALLDVQAPAGIFLNTSCDSVRDLV